MTVGSERMHDLKNDFLLLDLVEEAGKSYYKVKKAVLSGEKKGEILKLMDEVGESNYRIRMAVLGKIKKEYFDAIEEGENNSKGG